MPSIPRSALALTLAAAVTLPGCGEYLSCGGGDYADDITIEVDTTGASPVFSWDQGGGAYVVSVYAESNPDEAIWSVNCVDGADLETTLCISSPLTYGDESFEGIDTGVAVDAGQLVSGETYIVGVATYTDSGDQSCGDGHSSETTFTMP